MRNSNVVLAAVACAVGLLTPAAARAQNTNDADIKTFAVLPVSVAPDPNNPGENMALGHPEGLARDYSGNIYAATFDAGFTNYIYVYNEVGSRIATVEVPDDDLPLGRAPLGMVVSKDNKYLYVNEVLNGDVLRYDLPVTDKSKPSFVYNVCGGFIVAFGLSDEEFCALNANDIGPDGRIYISDNGAGPSFVFSDKYRKGRIYVLDPMTGVSQIWFKGLKGELDVRIASFPEFGVNGVAVSPDGSALFMANMSTDIIYKMPLADCGGDKGCQPGPLGVFVKGQGINGPDNIFFGEDGLLWVASGQNDRVVAIDPSGRIVSKVGRFEGMTAGGAPIGLLQPSGLVVSRGRVYVTNESSRGLRPTPDLVDEDFWDQLKLFTLVEIRPFIQR
jgi:sugar lactone lactonase YvrE